MKRFVLILVLITAIFIVEANEFERLKTIEARGIQNPDLYYNLGVTYWQTGQSGMATLYFLKTLNLNSAHKLAKENLNYALNLSQDRDLYTPKLFLVDLFMQVYDYMNLNRLALLSLVFLLFACISFIWFVDYDPNKERGLPSLILGACLFFLLISISFLGFKAYRRNHNNLAVLVVESAELRSEPDASAARVAQIHEGIILSMRKVESHWTLVNLPNGQSGWIELRNIATVIEG